jgi:hypothetical protein
VSPTSAAGHETHAAPPMPQADAAPGVVRHVLPWQQPLGQLAPSQMQAPAEQRWPAPQAAPPPHEHPPPTQASPAVEQSVHARPLTPHVATAVPSAQVPPAQHPPWHSVYEAAPQNVWHVAEAEWHDWPVEQSAAPAQPQEPAIQRWPFAFALQSEHAPPAVPQAAAAAPPTQTPVAQQPPWQGVWLAPPHAVVQAAVAVSHAVPVGQSLACVQPHAPATHRCPAALAVQSEHAPPVAPHWVGTSPAVQAVPAQQPPPHAV